MVINVLFVELVWWVEVLRKDEIFGVMNELCRVSFDWDFMCLLCWLFLWWEDLVFWEVFFIIVCLVLGSCKERGLWVLNLCFLIEFEYFGVLRLEFDELE